MQQQLMSVFYSSLLEKSLSFLLKSVALGLKIHFFLFYFLGGSGFETQINLYFLYRWSDFHQIFSIWS